MKRKPLFAVALTVGIAGVLLIAMWANGPGIAAGNSKQVTDGAFRDGLFQANLDVQNGREPHIASGRWSTDADRASFIAGYQQGYREFSEAHSGKLTKRAEAKPTGD